MHPTMRQLEALVRVYRLGSLTKAAAEMRMTQSAMSLLIRQLEDSFRLRLFERTTRALHPTSACREAIPIAERILSGAEGLSRHMQNLAEVKTGRISVAVSAGAALAVFPQILARYRKKYPTVEVSVYDVDPDDLLRLVVTGNAELGLGSVEDDGNPEVKIETLVQSSLSAIGIKDGKFERRKRLTWEDIADQPVIAMRRGTRIRTQIDTALARTGREFRPTLEVSLITTALALTSEGVGIGILPAHMLPTSQFPSLAAIALSDPKLTRHLSLIMRAGCAVSPAAQQFVEETRQMARAANR